MSHFAKVENGIVTQVIVAEQDFIDTGAVGHGWIQTSYNTLGNQHPEGRPLRGNYAGIGFTYDEVNDVFIAPKPFDNWILNGNWLWEPPIAMPVDEYFYKWNQEATAWEKGDLRPIPEPTPEPVVEAPVEAVVESAPAVEAVVEPEAVVEAPVEPSAVEVVTPVEPEVIIDASAPADTATASTTQG
jgi:hypothetical protein